MADVTIAPQLQFPQGTTVGLLILQGTSPMDVNPGTCPTLAPLVSMAPIMAAPVDNTNNNNNSTNNNNILKTNKNHNNKKEKTSKHQKTTKAGGVNKRTSKKTTGTTPPLKPPKKLREEDNEILRCKRRLDFARLGLPFNKANPVSVARRNERERRRVKQINSTFLALRDHLPGMYCQHKNPNKMSKVETLRGAIDYINQLQDMLDDYDDMTSSISTGGFPEQTSQQQQQQTPPQDQQQQQQLQQQQQQPMMLPPTSLPNPEVSTSSDGLPSMQQLLSVQAMDVSASVSLNSPTGSTGSTCSSVCSSASSNREPLQTDYCHLPYTTTATHPEHLYYPQTHPQDTHMDIKEEDLLEFAKWLS